MTKKPGIILLDIDDTILPSIQTHAGIIRDNKIIFDLNIRRLKALCEKFDLDVAIFSDWSTHIKKIRLTADCDLNNYVYSYTGSNKKEGAYFDDLKDALFGRIVDSRDGYSKESYIKKTIQDAKYNRIIVLDDSNFSSCCNYNNGSFYIRGCGFITNPMMGEIKNIMTKEDYKGV